MKKVLCINTTKLAGLSAALLLAVFCTLGMSFRPVYDENEEEEIVMSGPRRSHYYDSGCDTKHYLKDYAVATVTSTGNGSVSILSASGGGLVTSPENYTNGTKLTSDNEVSIKWNCNHAEASNATQVTATEAMHKRSFTIQAYADEDYYFKGWSTSTSEDDIVEVANPFTFEQFIDDWKKDNGSHESEAKALSTQYYAIFKPEITANLIFAVSVNGSFTYKTEEMASAETVSSSTGNKSLTTKKAVTLTATPASGYKFYGWYKNSDAPENYIGYTSPLSLGFEEDATVYAKFIPSDQAIFTIKGTTDYYHDLGTALTKATSSSSKVVLPTISGTVPAGNYTIPQGVTLLVPYDDAYTVSEKTPPYENNDNKTKTRSCYRQLTLSNGTNINVNGKIIVNANLHARNGGQMTACVLDNYGRLHMNEGSHIDFLNGSVCSAWGFITGEGTIVAKSGSQIYEPLQFDFRGGTHISDTYKTAFPMSQYYVQNIEAPITFEYGASETVFTCCYAQYALRTGSAVFIGSSGLFRLESGATLTKRYDGTTDRQVYDIQGNSSIQDITVDVTIATLASKSYILPINNNMTVNVQTGKTTIYYDTSILPDAQIVIAEGAFVDVKQNLYVYSKSDWRADETGYTYKDSKNNTQKSYFGIGADINPVPFSPTKTASRTSAKLTDAHLVVNGTLTMKSTKGYLYTTTHGADICSEGKGNIIMEVKSGTQTSFAQGISTASKTQSIPITPAKLHNASQWYSEPYTGTNACEYLPTAGTAAGTTITYANGHWGWVGIWKDYNGTILKVANVTQEELLKEQKPDDPTSYVDEEGTHFFDDWKTERNGDNQEITYTALFEAETGFYLDIVDVDNSAKTLTLNVTGWATGGWPYTINGTKYEKTAREKDRTLLLPYGDKNPGDPFIVTVKDNNGNIVSLHSYVIPEAITYDSKLSENVSRSLYVKNATLTIDGSITAKNIYVGADAKLVVNSGVTLTADNTVFLRTTPWEAAELELNGSLSGQVCYTRVIKDKSQYYQFGLPRSCPISAVRLSDGTIPAYGNGWLLRSYNEEKRARNGVGEGVDNWETLPAGGTIQGGVGYEMFSNSGYYREYYFPVAHTDLDKSVTVSYTSNGAAGSAHIGWNILCSPLMSTYSASATEADPASGLKVSWLQEDGSYKQEIAATIPPAIPFSYQASSNTSLNFGGTSPAQGIAPRRSYKNTQTETEWIHVALSDADEKGDNTSIFAHPDRFETGYETGIDVAKQSLTASRAIIYSSHAYGDMAFAGVADSLLEKGVALTVYSPAAQELTIALRDNNWLNRLASVWLIDKEEGMRIDLLNGYYTFRAEAGTTRGRFFIQGRFNAPNTTTDLLNGLSDEEQNAKPRKVLIDNKMYILFNGQIFDATGKLVNKK